MRTTVLLVSLILFGCASNDKPDTIISAKAGTGPGRYARLLSLYKRAPADSLLVYSSDHLDEKRFAFYGKVIDSLTARLFPKNIYDAHRADYPSLFACHWISLDRGKVGLITRVPSEYMPSSIQLFVLDTISGTLEPSIELAEEVGDAGDLLIKKSWLFSSTSDGPQAIVWTKELHDHSVDEEPDSFPEKWDSYYLISLRKNRQDTISTDSASLARRFEQLLKTRPAAK